jgi:branched-chain amino acid transport system substrate-binding protein
MAQTLQWRGRSWLAGALVIGFLGPLAGCGTTTLPAPAPAGQAAPQVASPTSPAPAPPTANQKIPGASAAIGLLLPLTGSNAALGKAMSQAGEMALFEAGDDTTALLVRDSEAQAGPVGGAKAALDQGAMVMLGPIFAAQARQVGPIAAETHVPVISFTTDRSVAAPGLYVMGILPSLQIEREVQYAASQGYKRFAALLPSTPYGQTVAQTLNSAATVAGGSVVAIEYYDPKAVEFSGIVQKLAGEGPFDALLIPEGGARLHTIAPLLAFYNIDTGRVKLLGSALWTDPTLAQESTLVGAWFAAPSAEGWAGFAQRYHAAYGTDPPRLASLAYDAVSMAATLAKAQALDEDGIVRPEGFSGIDGPFRFRPDGQIQRNLDILEVQPGGFIMKDPAAKAFPPPQG